MRTLSGDAAHENRELIIERVEEGHYEVMRSAPLLLALQGMGLSVLDGLQNIVDLLTIS
jgi:hypothetical protein